MATSFYVHIPFCKTICTYCDFCKVYYNPKLVDRYLSSLECELQECYLGEVIETLYIGGGTPSALSVLELKRLFQILERIQKSDNIEYTIECNFDSITKEKLDLFASVGINRLSFGLETMNPALEKFLGRKNDKEHILSVLSYAKSLGLSNINLDLMYALKGETLYDLKKDLDFLVGLDVTHISTYSLMIEKNTMLYLWEEKSIDSELDAKMYDFICSFLKDHGYLHYEISNFSKPGYFSRHNLAYWKNECYYGIGLGAASYLSNFRMINTRSMNHYLEGKYGLEKEEISLEEDMIYEVLLALRLTSGISLCCFEEKFSRSLDSVFPYRDLTKKGLLVEDRGYLRIPEEKLYISNYIIEEFIYGKE